MREDSVLYITCDSGEMPVEQEDGTPVPPIKEWTDNGIHMRMYDSERGPIVFVDYPNKGEDNGRD